jgi:glycosyltransferase involved in cell wall biosynthesis
VRAERNRRVAGARNLGVMASRGEYLTFLDDDDLRLPGSLDAQLEALSRSPRAAFVYGRVLVADQDGATGAESYPDELLQGDVFWELLERNFVPCGAALFRRSALLSVGLLDEAIPGVDDWDLWVRLAELYPVVAVEQPVAVWRRPTRASGQGSSNTVDLIRFAPGSCIAVGSRSRAPAPQSTPDGARRGETFRRTFPNI